ncbi:MAG: hypothetical protein QNJ30_12280 [Kiloniellales bacterium]|nr:hypothetical protein [Kiloniellales bacterium]
MSERELFISVDIEADGRIPGRNSMLSFGSAAFTLEKELVARFAVNLETLPGAEGDPETLAWWQKFPEAWAAARKDPEDPATALPRYAAHLEALGRAHGRATFIGFPAAYDFAWINWYLHRFAGRNPLGISGLCLKTLGAALLKLPFRQATKRRFPRRWFDDLRHSHVALDDAVEQGAMGINMLRELRGLPRIEGIVEPDLA